MLYMKWILFVSTKKKTILTSCQPKGHLKTNCQQYKLWNEQNNRFHKTYIEKVSNKGQNLYWYSRQENTKPSLRK